MENYTGTIGKNNVSVVLGDMTQIACDAYIVPQFDNCASYGGVGGAVARAGGKEGLDIYNALASKKPLRFGQVVLTKSGGGRSKQLLHVVSVGSSDDLEFATVHNAFYAALMSAQGHKINTIVAPAMGTGIIGNLTAEQSAKSMMSAIDRIGNNESPLSISLAIYGDECTFNTFVSVLEKQFYRGATPEKGKKQFNLEEWLINMQNDLTKNARAFGDENIG